MKRRVNKGVVGWYLLLLAVMLTGILVTYVFGGKTLLGREAGVIRNVFDKENSVPDQETDNQPELGQLVGELSGPNQLSCSVYYGDTDALLNQGAGISMEGVFPGRKGPCLIGGHDTGCFAPLEKIKKGDKVTLKVGRESLVYQVREIRLVKAQEFSTEQWSQEALILYTCYPFGETLRDRDQRYLVICTRTE